MSQQQQPRKPRHPCTVEKCDQDFSRKPDLKRHLKEKHGPLKKCEFDGCPWIGAKRAQRYEDHLKNKHNVTSAFELIIPEGVLEAATAANFEQNHHVHNSENFQMQHGPPQGYVQGYPQRNTSPMFDSAPAYSPDAPVLSSPSSTASTNFYQTSPPQNISQYPNQVPGYENTGPSTVTQNYRDGEDFTLYDTSRPFYDPLTGRYTHPYN